MHYQIRDGKIITIDKEDKVSDDVRSDDFIFVYTSEEWKNQEIIINKYAFFQSYENIRVCKLESHAEYLFGTYILPAVNESGKKDSFAFYILQEGIFFIDDSGQVQSVIEKLSKVNRRKAYSLEKFLYDFLNSYLEKDLMLLENIEYRIYKIEERAFQGRIKDVNQAILAIGKEISRLYRYYSQLTDIGEELVENEIEFFGRDDVISFKIYMDRADRLRGEAQILRDYAMQVQTVYQSEVGIRQNEVMRILTIVTTIFLPLSLIAGWYGMNFLYMPELAWKYSYPVVVGVCIGVIIFCLWLFKKKKFW